MANFPGGGVRTRARVALRAVGWALAVLGMPCAVTRIASAQVFQTDLAKTQLPQPVGTSELSLGEAYGYAVNDYSTKDVTGTVVPQGILYGQYYSPPAFPQFVNGDELTLAGLFKWRGEHIDPFTDAKTAPGHFFPGCSFTAELVLHGGGCSSALGWYNVPTGDTAPPASTEIYPLVPGNTSYLQGARTEFTPLGWDNRDPHDLSKLDWIPKSFNSGMILSDPNYAGGDIGFALVGDPLSQCNQNKFSVYEHNVKNSYGVPWVTALIYRSTVDPSGIYLAFEDLPMSEADWHVSGGPNTNDGDFNDFVFFVSGLGATASCPDPRCTAVTCDPGTVCSAGVCVPGGAGGAGGAGGGGGNSSIAGTGANGGASARGGSAGSEPDSNAGTAGAAVVGDGTGGTAGSADTTSAGTTATTNGSGGASTTTTVTNGGCSCRIGSRGATRYQLFWLAMGAAVALRRRRFQRVFGRRAARAIDSI